MGFRGLDPVIRDESAWNSAVGLPRRAQFDSVRTRSYKGSIAPDDLAALQREEQRPPVDLVNEDGGAQVRVRDHTALPDEHETESRIESPRHISYFQYGNVMSGRSIPKQVGGTGQLSAQMEFSFLSSPPLALCRG